MPMTLVDTHAHLNFKDYKQDLNQVIKRAVTDGVKKIVCVSSNLAESEGAIKINQKYPNNVFPAIGIHPHQTDPKNNLSAKKQIGKLKELAVNNKIVAIGECGLDFSPAPAKEKDRSQEEQIFLFQEQIKLAQELNLPLIIHSREAFTETLQIIKQYQGLKGVFHCYSAGKKGIEKINQINFLFGVDGNLTYDQGLQNVFSQIPLDKILLETDSPFLSPEPYRGLRNEPKNVKIIAKCLAQIKGVSFEEVAQATTKNAEILFKI